jgi:hypothetical protein
MKAVPNPPLILNGTTTMRAMTVIQISISLKTAVRVAPRSPLVYVKAANITNAVKSEISSTVRVTYT